jgi:hypothetical protein
MSNPTPAAILNFMCLVLCRARRIPKKAPMPPNPNVKKINVFSLMRRLFFAALRLSNT